VSTEADIAILGAGPAGANAALAADQAGARVLLVDDQPGPGGQVWRGKSAAILEAPPTPESRSGDALRRAIAASGMGHLSDSRVWTIERGDAGWHLHLADGAGQRRRINTRSLILAPGAREYVQPLPGWTLPGCIGLAGATAMMKRDLLPAGKRVVVCGTGPLVFFVASEIRRLGGGVAAIITANSRSDWLRTLPALASRPGLAARGALWIADLITAGVPILWRHTVTRIAGSERVQSVEVRRVDADWTPVGAPLFIEADACCIGHGLVPNSEPASLAGLKPRFDRKAGYWAPQAKPDGTTAIPSLFLCGDGAGIRGAAAAEIHGRLAGLSAAHSLGFGPGPDNALHLRYLKATRFGAAMETLSHPRPGLAALTTPETPVCRCENISRLALETEIASGAASVMAVKSGIRAGMGACGGRFCGTAVARILAAANGRSESEVPPATARPPLCPVSIATLAGDFRYEDLPIRKPAPL